MADTRQQPPRFTQSEAAEIIREATSRMLSPEGDRHLSREELVAMARELGVSEEAVDQALAARAQQKPAKKAPRLSRGALIGLVAHGTSYGIVISGLAIIDAMSGPGWWVQWPAVGWGMGLAFHVMGVVVARLKQGESTQEER